MKKEIILILISILFTFIHVEAQTFNIDTLQYQGYDDKILNLVIVGDGYTEKELAYFKEDAKKFTDFFFKTEPFNYYINYFNVFAINTISEESGAIHSCTATDCPIVHHNEENLDPRFNNFPTRIAVPESNPNTIFGSSFDFASIHRLVVPTKSNKIEEVLKNHIPNYSQIVVLVNSPFYGGSGGKYATATVNIKSNEIAVHEIGHSFAQLADEYWAGNQYATEAPNRTQEADPKKIPWKNWIGTNGVGIYSYGAKDSEAKWFRPHEFCKMQYLVAPFCNVCQEIFIQTILQKTKSVYKIRPQNDSTINSEKINKFAIETLKPKPNTLKVKWFLNDKLLTSNIDSIYLDKGILRKGLNYLKVEVEDTTALIRNKQFDKNKNVYTWMINAEKEYMLDSVISLWGDTLETCYNGYQALSIKNPKAGIIYKWYENEKSKKSVASGPNWVTPKLKSNKTFYVSANHANKSSNRRRINVTVLDRIERPKNIEVAVKNDEYIITIDNSILKKYELLWTIGKEENIRKNKSKITIPIKNVSSSIHLQLIDKITTCRSELFEIKLI